MNTEVQVLYFAKSAELAGLKSETIAVPEELTSQQLWQELENRHPRLSAVREQVVLAVRQEYVVLAFISVMNDHDNGPQDLIKLTHDKLSADAASEAVLCASCGAVSLFIGTTRNNFEGKKVVQLEYEAYVPMAESQLKKIFSEIRERWSTVRHICVHHRLGVVPVTEASVIIAISSPHRSESLQAVAYCIEALKASVPIWKKEVYETEDSTWKGNKECLWAESVLK
ncbi:hypothetical protein SKAU_G00360530 [Synaphobranchus kaupii]|uniref:Molybdopterin synthase catalytic subunit n=1 Tax=Synaphobranchus kaupii TaxID=118154 RepID=A0A9Q1EI77_SYNKA|nr:hypothetical protein SKAU_G00360530 [Synaphobranchus kaupii]